MKHLPAINTFLLVILIGLTLVILGVEPSNCSEESFSDYYAYCDKWGSFLLWSWLINAVLLVLGMILVPKERG